MGHICAVCYENCRGKCARCGASLCAQHRPKSARSKCAVCPTNTRSLAVSGNAYYTPSNAQAQAAYNAAQPATTATRATRPPVRPPSPPARDFTAMQQQDLLQYAESLIHRLELKQVRELAYLQRRYARGTYTPTDQAYGEDQVLEDELLELLRYIVHEAWR